MCNTQSEQIVGNVINDWVGEQKQFTAFDVTCEAKARGAAEYHSQLKSAVHRSWPLLFEASGYARQTIDIPDVDIPPWLYYPDSTDPQEYLDALAIESDDSNDNDDDTGYIAPPGSDSGTDTAVAVAPSTPKRAHRYTVPQKLIDSLGWKAGTNIGVWLENNTLVLCAKHDAGNANIGINADGRVRLNPRTCNLLPDGSHITAEIDGNRIIIRRT